MDGEEPASFFLRGFAEKMLYLLSSQNAFPSHSCGPFGIGLQDPNHEIQRSNNMASIDNVSKEALTLKPSEKAQLIDKLLSSLVKSDKEIDELWAKEVEERIEAYDQGKIKAISLEKVLEKYR
jgi:putative addiction module component (TIGR02574 family)